MPLMIRNSRLSIRAEKIPHIHTNGSISGILCNGPFSHRVTHLQCTPSLLSILLDDPESRAALGTISTLLVGGEALPPALAARVGSGIRLLNMYGPTETTIWSSAADIDPAAADVSIGQPLAGTMIQVLDERGQ